MTVIAKTLPFQLMDLRSVRWC